jgi:very-short-patch-repair endonuclease
MMRNKLRPPVLKAGTLEKRQLAERMRAEQTPSEAILWEQLRNNRLLGLKFRRQQPIDGFIVDFYCHAISLVIEVDGAVHTDQQQYDRERDAILQQRGLTIVRITNDEIEAGIHPVVSNLKNLAYSLLHRD